MSNENDPFPLLHNEPLLIVISGPSGAGKDSVIKRMKTRDLPIYFVVTATTRLRRDYEVHGVDYFFISMAEFKDMIVKGELLEYAKVYGDYKGIPKEQVRQALASGKDVILRIDVQGAATIREICPQALLIFLTTENEEELIRRLELRNTETKEGIKTRLKTARKELKQIKEFDYVVTNRDCHLDETVDTILAIIDSEHHRAIPRKVSL
jgi:guanylate kinase